MTIDEFNMIEKEKLNKRIEILENLLIHSKNKFLSILNDVSNSNLHTIESMINLIDEEINPKNISEEKNSKFNDYLKKKCQKG